MVIQIVLEGSERRDVHLLLGLALQVVGCACSAVGLAFMKLSSERDGDVPMWRRPLWYVGFLFLAVIATALEGVVLSLVPLTIVAPFAGLTILMSMLVAASGCISARVPLGAADAGGGVLTVVGVGLVAAYGPDGAAAEASISLAGVLGALANPQFINFITVTLLSVAIWLLITLAPPLRALRALADSTGVATVLSAYAASVCGALSQTFLKSVAITIGYSLARIDQPGGGWLVPWRLPSMWMALGGLAVCAPLQLWLLDAALASGDITYAVPLYQSMLVTLQLAAAAIFFHELGTTPTERLRGFAAGICVAIAGLVILARATAAKEGAALDRQRRQREQKTEGHWQQFSPREQSGLHAPGADGTAGRASGRAAGPGPNPARGLHAGALAPSPHDGRIPEAPATRSAVHQATIML